MPEDESWIKWGSVNDGKGEMPAWWAVKSIGHLGFLSYVKFQDGTTDTM